MAIIDISSKAARRNFRLIPHTAITGAAVRKATFSLAMLWVRE
jgi:hypothetical protein